MKRVIAIISLLFLLTAMEVNAKGNTIDGAEKIKVTAYTGGTVTASGTKPRYGICAGADWMLYDQDDGGTWVAMVWTVEGEFLGYFELLDRGGTEAIRNGYVIDIYEETYEDCVDVMESTHGECLIKYIKAYG